KKKLVWFLISGWILTDVVMFLGLAGFQPREYGFLSYFYFMATGGKFNFVGFLWSAFIMTESIGSFIGIFLMLGLRMYKTVSAKT
ncbi:hypothetical protein ACTGWN_10040, partial [Streptococcus suis]